MQKVREFRMARSQVFPNARFAHGQLLATVLVSALAELLTWWRVAFGPAMGALKVLVNVPRMH